MLHYGLQQRMHEWADLTPPHKYPTLSKTLHAYPAVTQLHTTDIRPAYDLHTHSPVAKATEYLAMAVTQCQVHTTGNHRLGLTRQLPSRIN